MYLLYVAGILAVLIIIYSIIEQRFLDVTRYTITTDKLSEEYENTTFVVLADLHNCSYGNDNKRLIHKIEQLSPDYIIVAGDMIVKDEKCIPSVAFTLLSNLAEKYKVYYGYGNHEQYREINKDNSWMEYKARLQTSGVVFLNNEGVSISLSTKSDTNHQKIRILGLSIDLAYFDRFNKRSMDKEYLIDLLPKEEDKDYKILIAHTPDCFDNYVKWGADLILSGHLHGGLFRIPWVGGIISPQVKLFPTYDAGQFTKGGKTMIVSRGLGSHSIMLRIFNRPEIVSIKLKRDRLKEVL